MAGTTGKALQQIIDRCFASDTQEDSACEEALLLIELIACDIVEVLDEGASGALLQFPILHIFMKYFVLALA